jgi:hypothetical protein
MNHDAIAAAREWMFTLDVASQIAGIPRRLILALVSPQRRGDTDYYALSDIEAAFTAGAGARLLRKLRQNQLHLYRDCAVSWRDGLGTLRSATGALVEIRGRRAEITLAGGYRFVRPLSDPDLHFEGTPVQHYGQPS